MTHRHASGGKTSPTYQSWRAMHQRCECPKNKDYHSYGGRGIEVDRRWNTFEQFLLDMGTRPSKEYTLDRLNPDKNYYKENCQWLTKSEQSSKRNKQRALRLGEYLETRYCLYCGSEFVARRCYIKKGGAKFCGRSCATTFNNLKRSKGGDA